MLSMFRIFYFSLLMNCCGHELDHLIKPDDARFYRYRAFFEKVTGHHTHGIPIFYGHENGNTIASCRARIWQGRWHSKHIVVDRDVFDALSVNWRRAIIAHELIHCHLEQKGHTHTENFELMNPDLPVNWIISKEYLITLLKPYKRK